MTSAEAPRPWWQDAVVYQIYVRSFQDSDGDGVGDLDGITARLDHLTDLGVDALWLDAEGLPVQAGTRHAFTSDRPETLAQVAGWRQLVDAYPNRVLIGEAHLPTALAVRYHGGAEPSFHLPFNFLLLTSSWDARALAASIDHYLNLLPAGAWPNWVLGNHDEPRVASRLRAGTGTGAALLALTLGGTPFIYNGDELGLEDATPPPDAAPRPDASAERDPQRTPMPWDDTLHAGFTAGKPWLPLGPANLARSVAAQADDPGSTLALYQRLLALRRAEPALVRGTYEPLAGSHTILAYTRELVGRRFAVVLNIGPEVTAAALPGPGTVLLSTRLDRVGEHCGETLMLRANEGAIVRLR